MPSDNDRRLRVLLVDDEPDMLLLLQALLSTPTWEIIGKANDGPTALRIAGHIGADIAVVDYMMPGMTGLELAAELKRDHPGCSVLVFSAYDIADEAEATGHVDRFVSKTKVEQLPDVLEELGRERGLL